MEELKKKVKNSILCLGLKPLLLFSYYFYSVIIF